MVAPSRDSLRTSWEGTLENQKGNSFHRMSLTKASCYTWISRHRVCVCVCVCVSTCMLARALRHVQLFATPWTIARQAPVHGHRQADYHQASWKALQSTLSVTKDHHVSLMDCLPPLGSPMLAYSALRLPGIR